MKNSNDKRGGVMVMVMVVMLAFTVLATGLYKLHQTDAVEAVYVEQSNQAFWLAESGMQRALHRIRTDKGYRDDLINFGPDSFSETIGNGTNYVDVAASGIPDTWNIVSTGTVRTVTRVLTMDPYLYALVGYALMGLNGDSLLNQFGTIVGDTYSYGTLSLNGMNIPSVTGEVLALDSDLDYTPLTGNDQIELEIDSSEFTPYFALPDNPPTYTNVTVVTAGVTNTYSLLDLTGSNAVVKVTGNFDLPNGTIGDGRLVVVGNLRFPTTGGTSYQIGSGATIQVAGDITAKKEGTYGDHVTVYATGNMTVDKTGTGPYTSFLVGGNFQADKELDLQGLLFAEGTVWGKKDFNVEGSVIAGEYFRLDADYNIQWNASYLTQAMLDKMVKYVVYATSPGTWNELPSP